MPGEVDRVAKDPVSFYGSYKSLNGYCTRRTISTQQIGSKLELNASGDNKRMLHSRINGRKLRCGQLTFNSSKEVPVPVCQNGTKLAPRHCRYLNMQVRRLPRHQFASSSLHGVNGRRLSDATGPVARVPVVSKKDMSLMEKALAKSRESRVLISAELKNKADSKMKYIMSDCKPTHLARDRSSNVTGSSHKKKVGGSGEVKVSDGAMLENSEDKGLQLRNGRSLPECKDIKQEKSVIGRQVPSGNERNVKAKKCYAQYRSRSLSPARSSLALSRPRRSANIKRSVRRVLVISTLRCYKQQQMYCIYTV